MRSRLLHLRESFWFLPALFGVLAVGLALGLVEVDHLLVRAGVSDIPLIEDLSPTGGRAILSAIGGTMLGVAATSFSITISVLATTSSAYGPRLVRNFMADRGNQVVLAVLTSTFLYSLIVLRAVHTEEDASLTFVPVVAVSFSVLLAVGDVAVLVYFIHHIALSVQVTTLQQRVLGELVDVIERLHPESGEEPTDAEEALPPAGREPVVLRAVRGGYVEQLEVERLVALARRGDARLRVLALPGDHVLVGDPVLEVLEGSVAQEEAVAAVVVADARTPHQDLRYAVQQVVEIGVRGLATGTNDPYTAVGAVEALTSALVDLCGRPEARGRYSDADGVVRLVVPWPRAGELLADVFLALRSCAMEQPLVVRAGVRLAERLAVVARGGTRVELHRQVQAFAAAHAAADGDALEAPALRASLAALEARLAA
ncbi:MULTISPECIES: DUF2254 domain-containing protein [unclassified Rathayibacter]|uniref:DUF2254 domain-containing protein n=1 Tax=unclassified Rathayibacter TaxID=2609250 RepID=UPI000CE77A9A|nr:MULTISPECIES: DUF2254 domain-containing protein [unclassified Rathayibacter]PPH14062.1 DUF2254 domain-containing protein [Rathayibacter sp. AY1F8]PPH76893.1 DUF2254 domain-containing protein [Rathayibacter sp. AY1D4]PPH88270.1 DUF2254 domain-containing protein [Rathayibacter sp. AY1D3]